MRRGAPRDHRLRGAGRPYRRRDPRAHARQRRMVRLLFGVRARSGGACADRIARGAHRMAALARARARSRAAAARRASCMGWHARRARRLRVTRVASYWFAMVHRLSGIALALFLPWHFWALSKGLEMDAFLRWT